VTERAYGTQNM